MHSSVQKLAIFIMAKAIQGDAERKLTRRGESALKLSPSKSLPFIDASSTQRETIYSAIGLVGYRTPKTPAPFPPHAD